MRPRVVWSVLLLAVGALHLSTAWAGWVSALVFALAATAPVGLVAIGVRLALPVPLVAATVVTLATVGAYLATAGEGGGLRDAVPRLLSAPRPAPATLDLMLPGAFFALLVSVWVAMRTLSARERRAGLVAAPAGAVALYAAAALLTAGRADRYGVVAVTLIGLIVAGWLRLDRAGVVAVRQAAPAVGVAVGLALLIGLVPLSPAYEPRQLVDPPQRTIDEPSPLPRIAAWQLAGDLELLRVRADGRPRLRLVTLAEFTGAFWSAAAVYRPLGAVTHATLPPGQRRAPVVADVTIVDLDGPWLPTIGHADTVSTSDSSTVDVEPNSGALAIRGESLWPGLQYRVEGTQDIPRAGDVVGAAVPTGAGARRYLETPRLPRIFAEYARQVTYGASTPFEQAAAIEYAVRAGRTHSVTAPTGSSYARLETFLFRPPGSIAGAHTGTSEQFATAFAVLARAVGLPTRVVVGFRPGEPGPDGTRVVRGRDVLAWPEVYFAGWGWYGFDPMTDGADGSANADEVAKRLALDRMADQAVRANPRASAAPTPASPPLLPTQPAAAGASPARPPPFPATRTLLTIAVSLALFPLVLVVGLRRVRRLRHRLAGDRGAWAEVLDTLVLLGRPAPRWRPATDIAADLAELTPTPSEPAQPTHPAVRIAVAAERAAFGPPGPAASADDRRATVRQFRRAVRAAVPWRRRLLWPLDPRPLRRR